ncbi:c-type cytochrome [Adhaeribacter swui]|uniref:C-type cytochrome n=1 Tax=Adhaeribacter swui TaxID=2086471 RepID=A0A7G7GE01_9BACT|nr:c-type cytochrome [Adhaeribacter swui]QNF35385.1 c-type cytochrome [Adhaeribacter swui]
MNKSKSGLKLLLTVSVSLFIGTSCRNAKEAETKAQSVAAATAVPTAATAEAVANPKVDKLKLPTGYKAEHLYSPSENKQGSWVAMAFDDKGRLITSDQYGSLYRMEITPMGKAGGKPKVERLNVGIDNSVNADTTKPKVGMGYAQGLLYAFNSLYVMINHNSNKEFEKGSGLYRLQDTNNDDQYDKITLLKELKGEGEHGPHSIKLSPDGKSLYVVAGNFTDNPGMNAYRIPKVWGEDNLIPLIPDPRGHATDRMAPAGWIAKVDPTGQNWEMIGAGLRNTYDIDFNEDGELFAYDSDMEWDFGMPWYKPTRILHVTSGSEFGWRRGNVSWSPSFADALPAVLNIGQGSPTNFMSGRNAKFPEKYRRAMYAFDWSFGIIYAVHLEPKGATYTATAEEFISGSPLPLTDGTIGPDGAMYFLTGGRRIDSDLYRVYYTGNEPTNTTIASKLTSETKQLQETRKKLEAYHTGAQAGAVEFAWPYLKDNDRFIRYAARVAVEHQPVAQWQQKALTEKDPVIATQAALALARNGEKSVKSQILANLMKVNYGQLTEQQQLDLVRAIEVTLARMGKPDAAQAAKLNTYLSAHYPAQNSNELNRQLCKVLVYIDSPTVVPKTLALYEQAKDDNSSQKNFTESSDLILRNPQYGLDIANMLAKIPPAQQMFYATALSEAKKGWTPALRDKYFSWFASAFKNYAGGRSFVGFLDRARKIALQNVPKDKTEYYNQLSGNALLTSSGLDMAVTAVQPKGPGRNWNMEEAVAAVQGKLENRNFEQGKAMFAASMCASCHNMRGEGGSVGPDLTQLGTRFSVNDMLESIIEPSKYVSDQYASTVFYLKDGSSVLGRLVNETGDKYSISQNPFAPDMLRDIPKKDVVNTKISNVSIMMPGMINRLNEEELKDLIAYLMAGGNKEHTVFASKK